MATAIEEYEAKHIKGAENIPDFRPGDNVEVNVKIIEGNNTRLQAFAGVVIARQGTGLRETFVVRKVSFGVGVERPPRWCPSWSPKGSCRRRRRICAAARR